MNFVFQASEGTEIMPGIVVDPPSREPNATRRYKLLHRRNAAANDPTASDDGACLGVAYSPDGLHFTRDEATGCVIARADTTTQVIWSESRQRYLAATRIDKAHDGSKDKPVVAPDDGVTRRVLISESTDFRNWTAIGRVSNVLVTTRFLSALHSYSFVLTTYFQCVFPSPGAARRARPCVPERVLRHAIHGGPGHRRPAHRVFEYLSHNLRLGALEPPHPNHKLCVLQATQLTLTWLLRLIRM